MLATFGSRLATAVVQPTVQAIAAGVLAGVVTGGALIVAGVVPPPAPGRTALLACPGSGAVVASVPAGQSLLATARSEDGAWLEIYIGQPGVDGAWAPAAAVHLQGSVDSLPVADCAPPSSAEPTPQPLPSPAPSVPATIVPSPEPSPSSSVVPSLSPSPSPKPTATLKVTPAPTKTALPPPPTIPPTPTPTAFVDHTAPVVSNITTTGYYDSGSNSYLIFRPSTNTAICGPLPFSATISATITDADDAVTEAVLYYQPVGGAIYSFSMTNVGGTTWQKDLPAQDSWTEGQIVYWIRALDSHSNLSSGYYPSSPYILGLGSCFA